MRGQSLVLLGAGILFGATGVYAQHPEGGHPEGQRSEPQHAQPRNDVPRANQGKIPPPPAHREPRASEIPTFPKPATAATGPTTTGSTSAMTRPPTAWPGPPSSRRPPHKI